MDVLYNCAFWTIDDYKRTLQLNTSIKSLVAIEQSVIFLLFKEDVKQEEAAKTLKICSISVRRIKFRAIEKLKNI